jgi:S-DNA-T family DNA segregation ATPase FtsK/SpoIIIE
MRSNLARNTLLFVAVVAWVFLMLALGTFHPTDWPSHAVYPHPPTANACGNVGAFVAYYAFLALGQGVFPFLLYSGICIALLVARTQITDIWLRAIGLLLVCIAFAAAVHHIRPGWSGGLPEGSGGIVGIGLSAFLQSHFNTIGTRLVLASTLIVGLLLAADDLIARTPALIASAAANVKAGAPSIPKFTFKLPTFTLPQLPQLSLPKLRLAGRSTSPQIAESDVHLDYPDDKPAHAVDAAHVDASDPGPSAPAIVPPDSAPAQPATAAASTDVIPNSDASAAPVAAPRDPIVVRLPQMLKPRQNSLTTAPPKELGDYQLPAWDCLDDAEHGFAESQEQFVRSQAAILEQGLLEFGIDAHVVEIDTGPVITMYEISLAPGIKVSSITALSNDIMRALKAESVRIVAPVPGKNTVGIEVPNENKEKVRLKELMQLAPDAARKMAIPLFLGKDASGQPLIFDLAAMPHCLIAGTTGSGKSVCINTIIMSVLYLQRPDMVKLILVDPKVVEMAPFKDIPHLMCPVINETGRATSVLEWACEKMDERYEFLAEAGVRNIKGYNQLTREELLERVKPSSPEEEAKVPKFLPYIVIIIDELADLMMTSGKEVEGFIVRLAQKSRAVGIHLILATQRPQATVVTGLIKSNMPARLAFRVSSKMDSRIVLDQNGADLLLGQGDMLFLPPGASKPIRSQGTFIDDKEIRDTVRIVRQSAEAQYEPELVQIRSTAVSGEIEKDELFDDAVRVVLETRRGSVSLLQRRLTIGYSRASRLIEQMAATGIVGDYKGSQAREATITLEEWEAAKAQERADAANGMTV